MVFYISDTHFGHKAIIDLCKRPFKSIDEMDSYIIEAWNSKVRGNDTVYIVGDMFYKHQDPESVLKKLKGKKHLIKGNHDATWANKYDCSRYFQSVDSFVEISDGKRNIVLCHYPMMTWNRPQKSYMIHGHVHNRTELEYWTLIKNNPRILNAGVDVNGFCPVTFEQMEINNNRFKGQ